jgi:hypothetical protein
MDQQAQEPSEDYGYDLAHEVRSGDLAGQGDRGRHGHHDVGRGVPHDTEPDGDYGYDEAHDL